LKELISSGLFGEKNKPLNKIADPENEPKMIKPATRAGFIRNYLRTGRVRWNRPKATPVLRFSISW